MTNDKWPMTNLYVCLAVCMIAAATCRGADKDGDGIPDLVETKLGTLVQMPEKLVLVATDADEKRGDKDAPDIVRFEACHVGNCRVLFRVTFTRKPVFAGATFIIYADMDNDPKTGRVDRYHGGVDVMISVRDDHVSASLRNPNYHSKNTSPSATVDGSALYVSLDAPLRVEGGSVLLGLHLLSQRQGGSGDSTRHVVAKLPFHGDRNAPKLPQRRSRSLRSLADYRYHDDKVKLEKLGDKGLRYDQVAPAKPIRFGRPTPAVPFAASRKPGKLGTIKQRRIPVHLLEEAGVARRRAPVTFGFPLPKGGLYDLSNMRVVDGDGKEVPAQFTATVFWPDDSLKWVLIDFTTSLPADGKKTLAVEIGNDVRTAPRKSQLTVTDEGGSVTVVTGPLKAVMDKARFNILRQVWCDKNRDRRFGEQELVGASAPEGIRLVDERGEQFAMSLRKPDAVTIEERGPRKVVVRVAGQYANKAGETYMSYITRLTFREGSTRVTVAHTHVNSYLKTEFTDITSLSMPLQAVGGKLGRDRQFELLQLDDKKCILKVPGETIERERYHGGSWFKNPSGRIGVNVHEFWQRWPKRLAAHSDGYDIDLLPKQPSADYGKEFPNRLMFPFVSGKYRFKWGMSFTTRITFELSGTIPPPERTADADVPVVAVLPASWYAETKALGDMAAPLGKQFAQWDKFVVQSYKLHMLRKEHNREYGYLNYGDWYGERGRNWGNNEYDLAHGLFMQFARTGRRQYYRLALAAARHQADVDCIHAYPDPAYVGANHLHSFAHTGGWSQHLSHVGWSHRYDGLTQASNGHTWADGMMDAWCLTGDARVMEGAIGLGEHIAWSMSRSFKKLGTHERSAGWSLAAIMAIYRGTCDPVYLEAAKRIARVPLREQKFDDGGSWPHVLPGDHSGGNYGARGNNLFLIGVLLAGLKDYHEETGDPAVAKALISGAEWVLKSWDESAEGWPYSATTEGKSLYPRATTGLNMLISEPLAYVGRLTGDDRYLEVVETAFCAVSRSSPPAFGKSVAQKMHFAPGIMGHLQQWFATHRKDKGERVLDGSGAGREHFIAKTRDALNHSVRAPDEKIFYVKALKRGAELVASRMPHGAMNKRAKFGTIEVRDAAGRAVKKGKFSTDGKHEFRAPLRAEAPGAVFKIVVKDDQRGVWSLAGENLQIVMQTVPGFRIGGVGRGRYYFFVPKGTKQFRVKLLGVHRGVYGGAAVTPDGKLAAYHESANVGRTHVKGAPKIPGLTGTTQSERGVLEVKPVPEDTGKVWSLVLWAHMDIGCELDGAPPFLAIRKSHCLGEDIGLRRR